MAFSDRLIGLRETRNLTQKQVYEGVDMSMLGYQRYEYGEREPSYQKLIALADYFDVSLDYLAGRSDDDTPLSFHSDWENTFRERLGEILPTLDPIDLYDAGVDVGYLESVAFEDHFLNFHAACDIADELGMSLDYLVGRSDDPRRLP